MFDKRTVFILGAGASWHYNYPTGEDLVRRIINKTKTIIACFENNRKQGTIDSSEIPNFFKERFSNRAIFFDPVLSFLNDFIERLEHVDPPVIDYFLAWNKDLQDIGRLIIAWVILDRESEFIRHNNINRNHVRNYHEEPYEGPNLRNAIPRILSSCLSV